MVAMAASHNLILWITVVTILTSVYSMQIPRSSYKHLSQNVDSLELQHSSETKERPIMAVDSPNSQENDILYLDRSERPRRIKTHSPIIQPVELEDDSNGPKIPESCKNSTYCEEVINYPEEAVSNLISTLGEGVSLQIDKLNQPDFTHRVSFDGNIELCESKETLVYPRSGIGYDNKEHLLLNGKTEKTKVQGFRVQYCLETECQCNRIVLSYQNGYRGRCKQFFIYRTATAFKMINSTTAEQYQTHIKLPGYCACMAEPCITDCDAKF